MVKMNNSSPEDLIANHGPDQQLSVLNGATIEEKEISESSAKGGPKVTEIKEMPTQAEKNSMESKASDEGYATANEDWVSAEEEHSVNIEVKTEQAEPSFKKFKPKKEVSEKEKHCIDEKCQDAPNDGAKKEGMFGNFSFCPTRLISLLKNAFYGGNSNGNDTENLAKSSSSQMAENLPKGKATEEQKEPPQIEETADEWEKLFLTEPITKWHCKTNDEQQNNEPKASSTSNGHHSLHFSPAAASGVLSNCEHLRLANMALREYLAYLILKRKTEKGGELLEHLALKPSFLKIASRKDNNISEVQIVLLKTYNLFNLAPTQANWRNENSGDEDFKIVTENFENIENCVKVLNLRKALREKQTLEMPIDETLKKYRKAMGMIRNEMERDNDYCAICVIPSVMEVLSAKTPTFANKRKEEMKKIAQKIGSKVTKLPHMKKLQKLFNAKN